MNSSKFRFKKIEFDPSERVVTVQLNDNRASSLPESWFSNDGSRIERVRVTGKNKKVKIDYTHGGSKIFSSDDISELLNRFNTDKASLFEIYVFKKFKWLKIFKVPRKSQFVMGIVLLLIISLSWLSFKFQLTNFLTTEHNNSQLTKNNADLFIGEVDSFDRTSGIEQVQVGIELAKEIQSFLKTISLTEDLQLCSVATPFWAENMVSYTGLVSVRYSKKSGKKRQVSFSPTLNMSPDKCSYKGMNEWLDQNVFVKKGKNSYSLSRRELINAVAGYYSSRQYLGYLEYKLRNLSKMNPMGVKAYTSKTPLYSPDNLLEEREPTNRIELVAIRVIAEELVYSLLNHDISS